MIFVTVGAQMSFDRLVRAVDDWAARNPGREIFVQTGVGGWRPVHCRWKELLNPAEFREIVRDSEAIVGHAGMGTILTALQFGRPVLVMPRRGALGETRNDHQVATARRFLALNKVAVAMDETELADRLADISNLTATDRISELASGGLVDAIRAFIAGDKLAPNQLSRESRGSDQADTPGEATVRTTSTH